jgi:transcriptional regulator of nitric oxide reductase
MKVPHDNRHAMRFHPQGTVVLRRYEDTVRGRIVDLATDGIGLHSDRAFDDLANQVVRVDITLDGGRAWSVFGHVVRSDSSTQSVAVAFDDAPCELEDYVQDQLLLEIEHDHVVLVDASSIAPAFRRAGFHVVETSIRDSVARIIEAGDELEYVLLPDTAPESLAEDMREALLAVGAVRDRRN